MKKLSGSLSADYIPQRKEAVNLKIVQSIDIIQIQISKIMGTTRNEESTQQLLAMSVSMI